MTSTSDNDTPDYLTLEYVENILKNYFKDTTLKVINMEAIPASAKGESYCSIMTRMKVSYKIGREKVSNQMHFIVKSTYENNPYLFSVLEQYDVYNTEKQMYEMVFPQLQKMLEAICDSDQLCAKTIYVDYERDAIIFEDLAVRDYTMANRLEGMDEKHLKLCLRKLAKMHATAAVLNEQQSGSLEKYCHGIFNRHVNCYGVFFENVIRVCAKYAGSCPQLGSYYKDKLLELIPYVAEYATRCYDLNPTRYFETLNHGDMWTNNVMVLYNDVQNKTDVKDILLIDFQYCNWTSPAIDLYYFLCTSSQDDLLFNHQPKLIQYYHQVLSETLHKLDYKQHIPTLHELNVQLLEKGFYAVTSLLVNLPLMINDKTEDADFESLLGSDEKSQRFHNVLYTNERVQRIIKVMLPRFDQMGLLDVVD
ncbi:uncharacterized protein LOC119607483 [Lucilia sericata]|uniref:uncharacterized protein LOC119607483 n=1 Tax=Lucilia sericata TaxID=13632 RepID=UPI0018A87F03|nr:uncharacterized protein LOC119607483 [Lucilia sericata]